MADWEIKHKPDHEFDGYPWHGPAGTDPTQYHIELKPEHGDTLAPVWVMWPSGEVYTMWHDEPSLLGTVTEMEEDCEPHSWMFSGLADALLHEISRGGGDDFVAYHDLIKEELDTIVTDSVHDWPTE